VVVVADPQQSEITDRVSLQLPNAQDDLIAAVASANPRTVVVVESGGPVAMPWLGRVAAALDQWYPGQADGSALADVLFGGVNPSGHLPVTFPRSLADTAAATPRQFPGRGSRVIYSEGLKVGYRADARPLFPFGYGLSYTSFTYATPKVSVLYLAGRPVVRVRDVVTNAGDRAGADVAQLYLGIPSPGEPPRQLAAYQRVSIAAGKSATVRFRIRGRQLAVFGHGAWRTPLGTYQAYVGDSSALAQLQRRQFQVRQVVLS
jgi:beta-glucosidase